jgi:hypothetical protein
VISQRVVELFRGWLPGLRRVGEQPAGRPASYGKPNPLHRTGAASLFTAASIIIVLVEAQLTAGTLGLGRLRP